MIVRHSFGTAALLVGSCTALCAQSPLASVPTGDATVANTTGGVVEVSNARAVITGGGTVSAHDHTAHVKLTRGGELNVCQSTAVQLSASSNGSLLIAFDRGAIELHAEALANDVLLTPDLRFTLLAAAPLDLQLRVNAAGDTCVNNRGAAGPTLHLAEAFGDGTYELKPGQHVLFEHGSVREVVDGEKLPCGCPPSEVHSGSIADALLSATPTSGAKTPAETAAIAHPFPAAVSEGLAEPAPVSAEAPGIVHVEVAGTLSYNPTAPTQPAEGTAAGVEAPIVEPSPGPPVAPAAAPAPAGTANLATTSRPIITPTQTAVQAPAVSQTPPPAKAAHHPLDAIGHFFKRLFVR